MIAMYVEGKRVGTLADLETLLPDMTTKSQAVELRDVSSGRKLATLTPEPLCPWEPNLTKEEIDRRCQRPGKPLSEILKRLGAE